MLRHSSDGLGSVLIFRIIVGIIVELILWIPVSFFFGGVYWFLCGVVIGVPINPFLVLWRNTYLACVGLWVALKIIAPTVRYVTNVGREWDSTARYLKWMKEHGKDSNDW